MTMLQTGTKPLISMQAKLAAAAIFVLGLLYIFPVYTSHDNDWILYMSQQLLHGKKAYIDFYEVNPPLIIWLNLLPAWLSEVTGLSLVSALKLCLFVIIAGVLCMSAKMIERLRPAAPQTLLLALTFVLTIMPASQFGQREHFMLILLTPYMFLIAARVKNIPLSPPCSVLIAIAAAIAICIKPYFVIIPAFCELYLLYHLRTQTFKRIEPYIMVSIGLLYLLSIYIFTPEYISKIVKYASLVYQAGIGTNLKTMLGAGSSVFLAAALSGIMALYVKPDWRQISPIYWVIVISLAAHFIIFFVQFKGWPNHTYPSRAMAVILMLSALAVIKGKVETEVKFVVTALCALFLVAIFKLSFLHVLAAKRGSAATDYFTQRVDDYTLKQTATVDSILIISALIDTGFPFISESGLKWGSRLPSMWLSPGIARLKAQGVISELLLEVEAFSHETIAEDLNIRKPDLVFVDMSEKKRFFDEPYDYIEDYSKNPAFAQAWQSYRLVESDGFYAVYERR